MRILLVEDDVTIADVIAEAIGNQRYVVDVATDGETAWGQIKLFDYDLILLDVVVPKLNGIDLCQRLRSHNYQMPILMMTARDTSNDKVMGLDSGADDYMVKPLDIPELLARIRALLRRKNSSSPILEWGDLSIDPATYEVHYQEQLLHLTPKEYSILELLIRNGRRIQSRSVIIERVWSLENPPAEDTVKAHIKSLRHKLRTVGAADDFIETVHGVGYRLKSLPEAAAIKEV